MSVTLEDIARTLADHDARIKNLEQRQQAHRPAPAGKKPLSGVVPDDIIDERHAIWWTYIDEDLPLAAPDSPVNKRARKLHFANERYLNPSEFNRWFARAPHKQIAHGGPQDTSIRRALKAAIEERRKQRTSAAPMGARSVP